MGVEFVLWEAVLDGALFDGFAFRTQNILAHRPIMAYLDICSQFVGIYIYSLMSPPATPMRHHWYGLAGALGRFFHVHTNLN